MDENTYYESMAQEQSQIDLEQFDLDYENHEGYEHMMSVYEELDKSTNEKVVENMESRTDVDPNILQEAIAEQQDLTKPETMPTWKALGSELKEGVAGKASDVKEAVTNKAGAVKDAVAQKVGDIKDTHNEKKEMKQAEKAEKHEQKQVEKELKKEEKAAAKEIHRQEKEQKKEVREQRKEDKREEKELKKEEKVQSRQEAKEKYEEQLKREADPMAYEVKDVVSEAQKWQEKANDNNSPKIMQDIATIEKNKAIDNLQVKAQGYLSDGLNAAVTPETRKLMTQLSVALMKDDVKPEKIDSIFKAQETKNNMDLAKAVKDFKNALIEAKDKGLSDEIVNGMTDSLEVIKKTAKEANEEFKEVAQKFTSTMSKMPATREEANKFANMIGGLNADYVEMCASRFETYKNCVEQQGKEIRDVNSKISVYDQTISLRLYEKTKAFEIRAAAKDYAKAAKTAEKIDKKIEKLMDKAEKKALKYKVFGKKDQGLSARDEKKLEKLQKQQDKLHDHMKGKEKRIIDIKMDIVEKAVNCRELLRGMDIGEKSQDKMDEIIGKHTKIVGVKSVDMLVKNAKEKVQKRKDEVTKATQSMAKVNKQIEGDAR